MHITRPRVPTRHPTHYTHHSRVHRARQTTPRLDRKAHHSAGRPPDASTMHKTCVHTSTIHVSNLHDDHTGDETPINAESGTRHHSAKPCAIRQDTTTHTRLTTADRTLTGPNIPASPHHSNTSTQRPKHWRVRRFSGTVAEGLWKGGASVRWDQGETVNARRRSGPNQQTRKSLSSETALWIPSRSMIAQLVRSDSENH